MNAIQKTDKTLYKFLLFGNHRSDGVGRCCQTAEKTYVSP